MLAKTFSATTVRFIFVGLGAAVLYFSLNYLFQVQGALSPFAAGAVAYVLTFGLAYLGQKYWAFKSVSRHIKSLPRYFVVQCISLFASSTVTHLISVTGGFSPLLSSAAATFVAGSLSYVLSSYWAFSDASCKIE